MEVNKKINGLSPTLVKDEVLLVCAICKNHFKTPRLLPCLHTFCHKCIEGLKPINTSVIECPLCRKKVNLPNDSAANYPINFVINNLLNVRALGNTKNGYFFNCDACESEDSPAQFRCDHCLQFLCDFCAKAHRRMSVTRDHNTVSIEELRKRVKLQGPVALQRPYFCQRHKGESLRYYCYDCNEQICRECAQHHEEHQTAPLKEAANQTKKSIEQIAKKVQVNSKPVLQSLVTIKGAIKEIDKRAKVVSANITETFEKIIELLQLRERLLLDDVEATQIAKTKILKRQYHDLENSLETAITGCTLAEHVLKEGSSVEILNLGSHITNRLEDLAIQKHEKSILQPQEDSHLEFALEYDKLEQGISMLGRIDSSAKACASASTIVESPALHYCPTGKRMALTLITKDSFSIPRRTGGDKIEGTLRRLDTNARRNDSTAESKVDVMDHNDGTYTLGYSTWNSGNHLLNVTINGIPLASGPIKIKSLATRNFQVINKAKLKFGYRGESWGELNNPHAVVCSHDNNMFVADTNNHRIQIFHQDGQLLHSFGSSGSKPGQLNSPYCLALDADGNVIVSDTKNHRIQVFTHKGAFIRTFGSLGENAGELNHPYGVVVDKEGRIYVADSGNYRIQVFGPEGEYLNHFGSKGNNPGQFGFPWGIALDYSGNIVVTDYRNHRIQLFDSSGRFLYMFGSRGNEAGKLNNPTGITLDPGGQIIVADRSNHCVQIFAADGVPLHKFGSKGSNINQLKFPAGVSVNNDNKIVVVDTFNNRIQVF